MGSRRLTLLLALLALLLGLPAAAQERRLVVIDDEGFGLGHAMLLDAPEVEVLGITTSSGNVWANRATALALRGLERMGRTEVPVVQGATYPLVNSEALSDRWEALYGKLTWKGAWMKAWVEPTRQSTPPYHGPDDPVDLPDGNPATRASPEIAANFLIRTVRAHPGEVTIIALGPLTNLALAHRLDPAFAGLARELVYMGGSLNPQQVRPGTSATEFAREFADSPRREFNARFDPEAASIVSRSPWRSLTVVPVDPSTATELTPALLARLKAEAAPDVARWIGGMEPGFPLWDEVAAAVWLDPAIATRTEDVFVDYDTMFGPHYGDMLSWHPGYQPGVGERRATVIRTVDPARVEALMIRLLRAPAVRSRAR
ncbi:MAG: nucleoside hydrolase [Sphingomonas taxi]|uniref:Nucleoside hydrolase n=1 Tax=Sphingomonas taxi TaxID=1549858 RepID=A0A2W5PBV2_9SPHN|nr:MAG: nucleoside hydrolase [Sphingomonas taxi]